IRYPPSLRANRERCARSGDGGSPESFLRESVGYRSSFLQELHIARWGLELLPAVNHEQLACHGPRVDERSKRRHDVLRLDAALKWIGRMHSLVICLALSIRTQHERGQ